MNPKQLRNLLRDLQAGRANVEGVMERLRTLPFENLGFAAVDHHRTLRQGFPEVIFGEGKTTQQILAIAKELLKKKGPLLATRIAPNVARSLVKLDRRAIYHEQARTLVVQPKNRSRKGNILILTAGTADIPVAEEARVTAEVMGSKVQVLYDVGVAGLHRVLGSQDQLRKARVLIVVAGMDGVLPSVVGGLVSGPVIAVPTSQGYGSNFGGLAPLLTMLNSCAAGVGVVNIDNGFGAGCLAHRINVLTAE